MEQNATLNIEPSVVLAIAGAAASAAVTAIIRLFFALLAAKDAHIAELREVVRYQRGLGGQAVVAGHRALDLVDKVT